MKEFICLRKSEDGSNLWNNKSYQKKKTIDTTQACVNGKKGNFRN